MRKSQQTQGNLPESFVQNIFENHHTDLLLFARGKIKNTLEGEEVMQDFYLKLMKKYSMIEPKYQTVGLPYLYKMISNLCLDRFRAQQRKRKNEISVDEFPNEIKSDQFNHDVNFVYEHYQDELQPLLTSLEYRLLVMRVQGYAYQDISLELNITENYVGVLLHRIRNKVAPWFERKHK